MYLSSTASTHGHSSLYLYLPIALCQLPSANCPLPKALSLAESNWQRAFGKGQSAKGNWQSAIGTEGSCQRAIGGGQFAEGIFLGGHLDLEGFLKRAI